ncbi:RAB18, member ras-like protein oncogene family [Pavlovales sp. CCMP2436]|nr:RAB18, member ras-like protein oncogene family [Pavlovales sp. CCMP2436]
MARADHVFKLLLVGDAGVGKSSMLLRFTDDTFEEHMASTIGVDFKVKTIKVGELTVKLTIWDTAGQERFRTLTNSYYRGCQGIILVFDLTSEQSLHNVQNWLKEIEVFTAPPEPVKLLVGNKADLPEEREVSDDDALAFARTRGMLYLEASAKTRAGIRQAFEETVRRILDTPGLLVDTHVGGGAAGGTRADDSRVQLNSVPNKIEGTGGGCGC